MRCARVLTELIRPIVRSVRWLPLVFSSAVGVVTLHYMTRDPCVRATGIPCLDVSNRIAAARVGAVLLALGVAFVLDDPTEESTAHLPIGILARRTVRVLIIVPAVSVAWAVLLFVVCDSNGSARGSEHFPVGALTLELAALLAVVLAVAVATAKFVPERLGGVAAGPTLLGLIGAALFLPARLSPFAFAPTDPMWPRANRLWQVALALGTVALVWWSVDPWRRRVRGRLSRTPAGRRSRGSRTRPALRRRSGTPVPS